MTAANAHFSPADHVPVRVLVDGGSRYWELAEDLTYDDGTVRILVPAGFQYDMASIPRFAWWFISPADRRIVRAATVHDRLYVERRPSRAVADGVFLAIMKADGMPLVRRWVAYLAVRLFGWRGWGR